jgi:hypothetical protein
MTLATPRMLTGWCRKSRHPEFRIMGLLTKASLAQKSVIPAVVVKDREVSILLAGTGRSGDKVSQTQR